MMTVHKLGHALAGLIGGGRLDRVVIPAFGFSRTDFDPNSSPRLEVWGGPIWGSVLPAVVWLLVRKKLAGYLKAAMGFFVGLCLVANGAYLGMGWTMNAGDAAELIKYGTPIWVLIFLGMMMVLPGLYIWHSLGQFQSLFKT